MDAARLLPSSSGQGGKKEDLEKPLSEAARGLKAEGLQRSGTGIGQDTVNAWFLAKDQEELGFIFHVWDVARGQGALNPSGARSLGGTHDVPLSTAAPPRAGPSPAGEGRCHQAKTQLRERQGRSESTVASGCRQPKGLALEGPHAWRGAGALQRSAPRFPGSRALVQRLGSPSPADARPLRCPRCTPVPVPAAGCYSN